MQFNRLMKLAISALAVALLAGCSKKGVDLPAKLSPIKATLRVHKIWSASVGPFHFLGFGDGQIKSLRLGLGLAVQGERVFASGNGGKVAAFDLRTGRELWQTDTRLPLAGGPAVNGDLLVVGADDGHVAALDAADGKVLWKVALTGAVISPPAVSADLIAIRTIDGTLHALSPQDGHELWETEQEMPPLSLRGAATPVITGNMVISGFANGKLLAVNAQDGTQVWMATVSQPGGRTAIERLADVLGPAIVADNDVYVVGYHGTVDMLALKSGQAWWSHKASSFRGLALGPNAVYMTTEAGEVEALNRKNGSVIWSQKALRYRSLTKPAVAEHGIVVADFQGYVHWLNKQTGAFEARVKSGGVRVTNPPVAVGNEVLVINDAGKISAFRVSPR